MKNLAKMLGLAAVLGAFLSATPAKAWYDQDGNWHSSRLPHRAERQVVFRDGDRALLKDYISENGIYCQHGAQEHRRDCVSRPDVLAFYSPGSIIPETSGYVPLPASITQRLAPAPDGTLYVRASGNIYLISRRDRTVVDAADLF